MPQNAFKDPKTREWVASALKEIGRDAKKPEKAAKLTESSDVQKQIIILNQQGNYKESMKILADKDLRPLTYQEALVRIDQNPELKEQLKGEWFWLAGKGTALSGYYTFDYKGELTQGKGDIEKTVYVYSGSQLLSLAVRADCAARDFERRFDLSAASGPSDVARVVVGVRF